MIGAYAEVIQGMAVSGRSAGARRGPWLLAVIESADIADDRLVGAWDRFRKVAVAQTAWTEKRLLRPFDLLVTSRSQRVKLALVPAGVARTVAAGTLLVIRTPDPGSGLAHYLWYYLTSRRGRAELEGRITRGMTIPTLSARALAEVPVPLPSAGALAGFARLVEESNAAHDAALEAVRIRRDIIREAIIARVAASSAAEGTWR